ncbi:MAG: DMSO reductase, partial [Rhizobiaceae bacterium]
IALLLGFVLPIIFLTLSLSFENGARWLLVGAFGGLIAGIFVERWLFFATAKHAVGLYYGGDDS